MGKHRDHRKLRRGRHEDDVAGFVDNVAEPAYFQRLDNMPEQTHDAEIGSSDSYEEIEGTVKWYNGDKGFGFISPASGSNDVFVHATALSRSGLSVLAEGQKVLVKCASGRKGLEVHNIRVA